MSTAWANSVETPFFAGFARQATGDVRLAAPDRAQNQDVALVLEELQAHELLHLPNRTSLSTLASEATIRCSTRLPAVLTLRTNCRRLLFIVVFLLLNMECNIVK
jgi:hypothetical protein